MKILNKDINLVNNVKKRGRKTTNKIVEKNNLCVYDNSTLLSNNYLAYLPISNEDILKIENKEYYNTSNINSENIDLINNKNTEDNILTLNINNIKINDISIKSQNIDYNKIKDVNCWWCTLLIEGKIFGIPEYYKILNDQYNFFVNGFYCSVNCCLAHCIDLNDNKMWEKISLIYMMRDIIFNINNIQIKDVEIIQSKPKYVLNIYGGDESIEEYKKDILLISKNNDYIYPILNYNNNFEEKNKIHISKNDYKLKRSKPLNNNILFKLLYNKNNI